MIQKQTVEDIIVPYLSAQMQKYELITLEISSSNDILVELDSFSPIDVDFCAALSRHIQEHLDREAEDYSLEVGSVSLTDPFKSPMQYTKHIGDEVEVLTKEGQKLYGVLVDADEAGFSVETEVMVAVEGKKRKQKQLQTLHFAFADVKYTRYNLKV